MENKELIKLKRFLAKATDKFETGIDIIKYGAWCDKCLILYSENCRTTIETPELISYINLQSKENGLYSTAILHNYLRKIKINKILETL